jgi:Cd2+/Zn2+-exporting ATPase
MKEAAPLPSHPSFIHHLSHSPEGQLAALGAVLVLPGLIWTEVLARESELVEYCSLAALAVAGWPVMISAFQSLVRRRQLNINVLMTTAAIGAVFIGAYTEAAMVMVLFSVGELLESHASRRAKQSIRDLMQKAPEEATRLRGPAAEPQRVPVGALEVGDRIVIRPGERIPMDGVIALGSSMVNQAPITGESRLVELSVGDTVYAGTVNGPGALEVVVSRPASDTTISRMIRLIEDAHERKAPAQRFVDRFAQVYTPIVAALALVVAVGPPLFFGETFIDTSLASNGWLYRGLTLLVVACPCALVLSTPVCIISAITNGARFGVLFKGGLGLEELSQVRAVAFDKTGTLTEGAPTVVSVRAARCHDCGGDDCTDCNDLVALVSAVGRRSEHPLARAIVDESVHRGVETYYPVAANVAALTGQGMVGQVDGRHVEVGSHRYFDESIPHDADHCRHAGEAAAEGLTPVLVSAEGSYLGLLTLSDSIRRTSQEALQMLRRMRLKLVMLTGDSSQTAEKVGSELGLAETVADLLPEDKVEAIQSLRNELGKVAMVGDGLNDAPALATADVGIALGGTAGGTDQAIESADITLLGGDLRRLPFALKLSRVAMNRVQTNIAIAIGLKVVFLGLVIAGLGTMWMAVAADVGTTILVTLNGLRLLRAPRPERTFESA